MRAHHSETSKVNLRASIERRRNDLEMRAEVLSGLANPFTLHGPRQQKPIATTLSATARTTLLQLSRVERVTDSLDARCVGIGREYFNGAYHVPSAPMELDRRLTAMTLKMAPSEVPRDQSTLTPAQRRLLERAAAAHARADVH